ncbi:manganese/iron ABC transporter ATP-binding protein [Candidatus Pantoea multigeneris]|uniref:Manganese/iron ABC transporter ATP-binding protein n=1 Tax=Candidatus Pantoea multigeneris TaxID=2608357 RepID=A0ABX0RGF2_9GAMM|nr:manganese/iron ABC transporter ATP-binding protein [Pantoea multigeneris]NIF22330.1 manganese/iron ABC transporter ATP-binding protein [Pantoea multigeneris]
MSTFPLSVNDLSVTYRNGHTALRQATFSLPAGSITALIGVNGSGKSTLFKAIMGFVPLTTGEVHLSGEPIRQALKQNKVSYVPQAEEVDWSFPVLVEDVVMMGRYGYMGMLRIPRAEDKKRVDEALARVGMSEFRHRQIGELSGGQKKRVFLARAIAQSGEVILLDEPFTGVDIQTETAIRQLLQEMREEGRTMLVSTHDLNAIPDYCDRCVLVRNTVLASGTLEEAYTAANLARAFEGTRNAAHPTSQHRVKRSEAHHVLDS